jgi:putative OPT family oligopeptide transporter
LISALAEGVIQGNLDWNLLGDGVLLGVAVILLDEILKRTGPVHMPPLAVGLGIYLPTATTLMIVVGAVAGWALERRAVHTANPASTQQLGVLLASGLIVGEGFALAAVWIGGGAFAAIGIALYAWLNRLSGPVRQPTWFNCNTPARRH